MGCAKPLRIASTPATKVVATAPMPGIMMPSLPRTGAMLGLVCLLVFVAIKILCE